MTKVVDGKLSKDVQYRYDKAGVRTGMVNPESTVVAYSYDAARRMTKVAEGGSARAQWLVDLAGRDGRQRSRAARA